IRLSGTLTEVDWVKGRCILVATSVMTPNGTDGPLPRPKAKTITLGTGTTYAMLTAVDNGTPIRFDEVEDLKKGTVVFVIGKNLPNGVLQARLICIMPPAEQVETPRE